MSRSRGREARDPFPSPAAFRHEINQLIMELLIVRSRYRSEYRTGLESPGGSGVNVASDVTKPTETAWESGVNERARENCKKATSWIRQAAKKVAQANRILSAAVEQPTEVAEGYVVPPTEFDRALHRQREEELRA